MTTVPPSGGAAVNSGWPWAAPRDRESPEIAAIRQAQQLANLERRVMAVVADGDRYLILPLRAGLDTVERCHPVQSTGNSQVFHNKGE